MRTRSSSLSAGRSGSSATAAASSCAKFVIDPPPCDSASVAHVELVVLFLLVAVAALTALARRARRALPDHARARREPRRLRARRAGDRARAGARPADLPAAAAVQRGVLLVAARPARRRRGRSRSWPSGSCCSPRSLVALVAHAAIDGLPWAAAFALGAIVSPTDPLAATAIMRRLGAPRRLVRSSRARASSTTATALVIYRTRGRGGRGHRSTCSTRRWRLRRQRGRRHRDRRGRRARRWSGLPQARRRRHRRRGALARRRLPRLPAGRGAPRVGVLAAVAVGLSSAAARRELSTPASRLRGYAFWEVLVFLLNAVLFVLVGLQLPTILDGAGALSPPRWSGSALLVSAVVIGARLLWVIFSPFVIRALDRRESQRARRTHLALPAAGRVERAARRGLAGRRAGAAAGLPRARADHLADARVIFATLVGQGLTLPWLLRRLGSRTTAAASARSCSRGGRRPRRRSPTSSGSARRSGRATTPWSACSGSTASATAGSPARGRGRRRRGGRRPRRPVAPVPEDGPPGARRPAPPRHRAA